MNNTNRPVGIQGDPVTRLTMEVEALRREVASLRRLSRPTIPNYSQGMRAEINFNNFEYYIVNDKLYFISSGIERLVTSSP